MRLSELKESESGIIVKVLGRGAFRKRITEMGFIKGKKITVVKDAPLKDPVEYNVMGYEVSLRRGEASLIEVVTKEEIIYSEKEPFNGTLAEEEFFSRKALEKGRVINVALVGNPNSGKTTLFNHATNSRERVGNYSGVTIDAKTAQIKHKGYTINITDLPGTYSLTAYTPEELFVRSFIYESIPDVIINIVDASNLERNLYLTTQLIDMDMKVVVALNMYDDLQQRGDRFEHTSLGKMIGTPFVPTVSSKGQGISDLFDKVINIYADKDKTYRHVHISLGDEVEQSVKLIQNIIKQDRNITDHYPSRYLAIKLLEKDKDIHRILQWSPYNKEIDQIGKKEISKLETIYKEDSETIITDLRYGFISGALKETYMVGVETRRRKTELIDDFLTNKLFGFPFFIFFLWLMFQATFTIGAYPQGWIEQLVSVLGQMLHTYMPEGPLKDLLIDGVVGGVGGVIVFLPNILILFFFISLMEDTGYMARVAFIMDKLMHRIGLHGRSFIPLIMGFGCNVPAIMATRTIENRNNRLLTMLINPFMSCSARLPVFVLFISAFFPDNPGSMLFLMYSLGVLVAVGVAMVFKRTFFRANDIPFVMELPPYRVPTMQSTTKHMWYKGEQYLKKMGGVILVASIIIWALGYFPQNVDYSKDFDVENQKIVSTYDKKIKLASDESIDKIAVERDSMIQVLTLEKLSEHQERSYIGQLGKAIEPVMSPLGFDWKMSVSLLTGITAKEVVVSTMGVLYQADVSSVNNKAALTDKLKSSTYKYGEKKGMKSFNSLVAFVFMLFTLIYFPCIAVMAAISKESGSWKWAAFTLVYTTGLAWVISFIVYQIGSLFI